MATFKTKKKTIPGRSTTITQTIKGGIPKGDSKPMPLPMKPGSGYGAQGNKTPPTGKPPLGGPKVTPPRGALPNGELAGRKPGRTQGTLSKPDAIMKSTDDLAGARSLTKNPGESDADFKARQEAHKADRQKLVKKIVSKAGAGEGEKKPWAPKGKEAKADYRDAREKFQKLTGKRQDVKAKIQELKSEESSESTDNKKEESAEDTAARLKQLEERLASLGEKKKEVDKTIAPTREKRSNYIEDQYLSQLQGKSDTLYKDQDRVKRLKKALKKKKPTYSAQ